MTPVEIVLSVFLLIYLPIICVRITRNIFESYSISKKDKNEILEQIETTIQSGISILKNVDYSESELRKIKKTRDTFLQKTSELIRLIAECASCSTTNETLDDKVLYDTVTIDVIKNELIKKEIYFSDYIVIYSMVKSLICDAIFPKKEDYVKLNELHKKYTNKRKMKNARK